MEINQKYDSTLFLLARESRGLSQKELAEQSGISQSVISNLENGFLDIITPDAVDILARVLRYPVAFFSRRIHLHNPNNQLWRKRSRVPVKVLKKALAKMNLLKADVEALLVSAEPPDANFFTWNVETQGSPLYAARELRRLWRLPKGRIDDLSQTIEDNGIIIVPINYEAEDLDGMNMLIQGNTPLLFVERNVPADRFRMSLAHELGHIIMHANSPVGEDRDPEAEAMLFATEFLMPQDEIRPQMHKLDMVRLGDLKRQWKVSMSAILVWAGKMDPPAITYNQQRYLFRQMAPYRLVEPPALNFPRETPTLLQEMLDFHFNELNYDLNKILKLFYTTREDYEDRFARADPSRVHLRITR
jgi:Zn-dependent peptidase ImmA (M78 family)/predicted XRE-type DNA-binding protein